MPTPWEVRTVTRAARRYGIPPSLLYGVWGAETGFRRGRITSPAGALGPFQFMPGTASGMGIDPLNFRQAAFGAARYLAPYVRKYGKRGALVAYNAGPGQIGGPLPAETRAYIPRVLQLARGYPGGGGSSGGRGGGRGGGGNVQALLGALSGPSGGSSLPGGSGGTLALLQALQGAQGASQPPSGSGGLPTPAFSAAPVLPQGAQPMVSGGGPHPKQDIGALLEAVRTIGEGTPGATLSPGGGGGAGGAAQGRGRGGGSVPWGKVTLGSDADRAGVSTRPVVFRFLRGLAGLAGHPITIGTGSNHSQMTTSGNVSDHWTGHAADVPASGAALTRLGRLALMRAGMPRSQARKATGGIYNLTWKGRRVQVIFNTTEGGNHWNHLHVGISA